MLVLGEPANGLDPEGVHWLHGLVRGLADQGRTVLVSSRLLAEVAQTVDQVVIIDKGRLVAQSTLAALTAGADRTVRVRTPDPGPARPAGRPRGHGHRRRPRPAGRRRRHHRAGRPGGRRRWGGAARMRFERSNLEDVFLELTAGKGDPR